MLFSPYIPLFSFTGGWLCLHSVLEQCLVQSFTACFWCWITRLNQFARPPQIYLSFHTALHLLWPLLTSQYVQRMNFETSPGKSLFLPPIPAASTTNGTNYFLDVTMMCLLIQPLIASYTVSVRQYRILQSGFLHCCNRSQPACHLLTLLGFNPSV